MHSGGNPKQMRGPPTKFSEEQQLRMTHALEASSGNLKAAAFKEQLKATYPLDEAFASKDEHSLLKSAKNFRARQQRLGATSSSSGQPATTSGGALAAATAAAAVAEADTASDADAAQKTALGDAAVASVPKRLRLQGKAPPREEGCRPSPSAESPPVRSVSKTAVPPSTPETRPSGAAAGSGAKKARGGAITKRRASLGTTAPVQPPVTKQVQKSKATSLKQPPAAPQTTQTAALKKGATQKQDAPQKKTKAPPSTALRRRQSAVGEAAAVRQLAGRASRVVGTAKRATRPVAKSLAGITKGDLQRLARRAGCQRMGTMVYDETRTALRMFLDKVLADVAVYSDYGKRKTASSTDVVASLRRQGKVLYGVV